MNYSNLKYFIVLAEELNFTRAAKRLYVTQQTLSGHISRIEKHFGTKLFDRTPPLTLTVAGKSLYKNALFLMQFQRQVEREIQDIIDFKKNDFSVGITRDRSPSYLPLLLPTFYRQYPSVKIDLLEGTSEEISTALFRGDIDLSIGSPPMLQTNVHIEEICEDKFVVMVPRELLKKNTLIYNANGVFSLETFRDFPFLAIHPSYADGARFLNCCEKNGFVPNVIMKSKSMHALISLCFQGLGVLVCRQVYVFPYLHQTEHPDLKKVALFRLDDDYEVEKQSVSVHYLEKKYLPKAAYEFIKICKENLNKAYQELFQSYLQ